MGYERVNALDIIDFAERRVVGYRQLADHLLLLSNFERLSTAELLRHFSRFIKMDCDQQEQLCAMVRLDLLAKRDRVDIGVIDPEVILRPWPSDWCRRP